jgi:spermidine synthase
MSRRRFPILFLFALSGAAGLAYETLWLRTLVLTFGSTVLALGTILAAFLGGLAAGSLVIGRATAGVGRPLRLYGRLEIGIGLTALVLPLLFRGAQWLTLALFPGWPEGNALFPIVRFALAFSILLIPTFLMGGTLPAMARYFVQRDDDLGREGGLLYFANTAGAVLGTAGTAFVLLPALGMAATNLVAVACNILVGVAVLAIERKEEAPQAAAAQAVDAEPAAPTTAGGPRPWVILALYAAGGFAALALEVLWTRALVLTLGTTVYAFATMLSTYLLGLAFGGLAGARIAARSAHPARALGVLFGCAGLAVLAGNRLLGDLPLRFLRLQFSLGLDWGSSVLVKFLLAFLVMLPATFFLGAAFPLALRAAGGVARDAGAAVGRLYAANTAGSILGSLLAGLTIVPALGIERGLVAMGAIFLGVSALFCLAARSRLLLPALGIYAAALIASSLAPGWDRYLLRSGVYFYAARYTQIDEFLKARRDYTMLSYVEGPEATVAVVDGQKHRYLQINGKTDASTGKDMITQVLSAHLPLLFHDDPKRVLVIGLGSGVTVGSAARHPVASIRCLEISPEVVDAASLFAEASGDALNDPRVTMTIGDGRNFLLHTRERFDVVISEPSNPWIAGVGNLFTREFLELVKSRLAPGGVMCQWTNLYDLSERDLAIMLATYREAFPHGAVFLSHLGDLLLIGTDGEPRLDFEALLARVGDPKIQADFTRVGIPSIYDLFGTFLGTFDAIAPLVEAGTPVHTDDRAQLEFSAPRNVYRDFTAMHLEKIVAIHQPIVPLIAGVPQDETGTPVRRAFTEAAAARNFFLQGVLFLQSGRIGEAVESMRQAHRLAPLEKNIAESFAEYLALEAEALAAAGNVDAARARYAEAYAAAPADARYAYYLGEITAATSADSAVALLARAVDLDPKLPPARFALASALASLGRFREARHQIDVLLSGRPDDAEAYVKRGNIAATEGDFPAAMQDYLRAVAIEPRLTEARVNLAFAYARTGRLDLAIDQYEQLHRDLPQDLPILFNLATLTTQKGDRKAAVQLWEKLVRIDPTNPEFQRNLSLVKSGAAPSS